MQTKHFLTAASAAFMVVTTATANADDGYDAPESWPSPMQEHNMGMALFDRLEYSMPDKGLDTVVWDFQGWYGGDVNRVYIKSEGENVYALSEK